MKSPFRSLFLAGVLVAATPLVTLAHAPDASGERPAGAKGEHRGRHRLSEVVTRHAQELGVSADTIAKMKAAEEAAKPELERLRAAVRTAREKVAAGGDRAQLDTARQAMHTRHQALREQLKGMLTEEQRTKLRELAFNRRGGHGRRGGPGPDKPAPTQTQ